MTVKMKPILFIFALVFIYGVSCSNYKASVYVKNGHSHIEFGLIDKSATAYGYFSDDLLNTGWGVLDIKAGYGTKGKNVDLMYAAGVLEGALTAKHIWTHYQNMFAVFLNGKPDTQKRVQGFFLKQKTWTQNMITKYGNSDAYWRHVSYIQSQFDGLYTGYQYVAKNQTKWVKDIFVVQLLNAVGDLIDLVNAVSPKYAPDISKMTHAELLKYIESKGHCSALVKITGAYENIFMGHSSWFAYSATNRIYKHYDFNVDDKDTAAKKISFSSYPGFLESLDDFYTLGSNMVMLQTTNNVFDKSLYKYVVPESLFAWQRVRIANMMASNGQQWYNCVKRYNSGTYNNQYMVIDLKRIKLGKSLEDGTLWVVEQIPSLVKGGDQTAILRTGYWPSYNVPFYEEIYNKSGYPDYVSKHGTDFSYQLAPRAKIFRRDQGRVKDMDSFKQILRYNDYKDDPYSEGGPCNTICCRGDLSSVNPRPNGCYDTKVTDFNMAQKLWSYSINGPTLGDNLQPFSWTGIFANMSHVGLPEKYIFKWVKMMPSL